MGLCERNGPLKPAQCTRWGRDDFDLLQRGFVYVRAATSAHKTKLQVHTVSPFGNGTQMMHHPTSPLSRYSIDEVYCVLVGTEPGGTRGTGDDK